MTLAKPLSFIVLGAVLLPLGAAAQDVSVEFRLAGAPGNITGCIAADPSFTRVHTFTVKSGQAELTSAGGINSKMKLDKPGVYETDYQLGQLHLHVAADLNTRTLTVTERNLGCRWTAKKE